MGGNAMGDRQSILLDYPLRPDFMAHLILPRDLTAHEASQIVAFLQTFAGAAPELKLTLQGTRTAPP